MINSRINQVREILNRDECALISSDTNRRYFTGFNSSAGTVIITKEAAILFIDFRYYEKAKATVKDLDVVLSEKLYTQITETLKKSNIKTIILEADTTTVSDYDRIKSTLSDFEISANKKLSEKINNLRQIK